VSDAFSQQIGKHETAIKGFDNLFALVRLVRLDSIEKRYQYGSFTSQTRTSLPFSAFVTGVGEQTLWCGGVHLCF
jgi:hypothetical protein